MNSNNDSKTSFFVKRMAKKVVYFENAISNFINIKFFLYISKGKECYFGIMNKSEEVIVCFRKV